MSAAALRQELDLAENLLFRHYNQHRRSAAFRSFRSAVVAVRRLLLQTAALTGSQRAGEPAVVGVVVAPAAAPATAPVAARARARRAVDDTRARLLAHARRLTAEQRGAGFAGLFAVLVALVASMLALLKGLGEELR